MSLIDQANDQKHVWKTLDILCEIIERRETSQAEHTRLGTIDGSNKGTKHILHIISSIATTVVFRELWHGGT